MCGRKFVHGVLIPSRQGWLNLCGFNVVSTSSTLNQHRFNHLCLLGQVHRHIQYSRRKQGPLCMNLTLSKTYVFYQSICTSCANNFTSKRKLRESVMFTCNIISIVATQYQPCARIDFEHLVKCEVVPVAYSITIAAFAQSGPHLRRLLQKNIYIGNKDVK